jgi:hypothetical protein
MIFVLLLAALIVGFIISLQKGVFRNAANCHVCGVQLTGTEQNWVGYKNDLCLCNKCLDRINPLIKTYATQTWNYQDYINYINWDESSKEMRKQYKPNYSYGDNLSIDTEHNLFCVGDRYTDYYMIFNFSEIDDFEMNFRPEEIKEGIINDKLIGSEFVRVDLLTPKIHVEETLKENVKLKLKTTGFFKKEYDFQFTDEFLDILRVFSICLNIESQRRYGNYQQTGADIDEVQKALALFMFDSLDDVSKESLKKQRNALIKAFHPDNNESNETYSQKINAAYDLLYSMVYGNNQNMN